MGYEDAVNLAGGFEAWEKAGYPVSRAPTPPEASIGSAVSGTA